MPSRARASASSWAAPTTRRPLGEPPPPTTRSTPSRRWSVSWTPSRADGRAGGAGAAPGAPRTLPQGARFVRGLVDEGVMEGLHTFLPEVNPLLSYANFGQLQVSTFISNAAAALNYRLGEHPDKGEFKGRPETQNGLGALGQFGALNEKTVRFNETRRDPGNEGERGNAYVEPSAYNRQRGFGIVESWDCVPAGGQKRDPSENNPPCSIEPDSLFDGNKFPRLSRGERSDSPPVRSNEPCNRPNPPD